MKPIKPHNSQRGLFAWCLYDIMLENKDVYLITCDLGYKIFDFIRDDFPDRFINCGASEQAAMDIAVGLSLGGKVPFIYSITPFILWRSAESIRLYLSHEGIPVKIVGAGRDDDYKEDGFSHYAHDVPEFMAMFPNIVQFWPEEYYQISSVLNDIERNGKPSFLSLKR
jgi:transketolase